MNKVPGFAGMQRVDFLAKKLQIEKWLLNEGVK